MTNLKGIWVVSGTEMDDSGQFSGFITIKADGEDGTVLEGSLAPDDTRAMALNFLQVAEAAEQDAIIFTMLTRDVGLDPDVAAVFVRRMRDERSIALHREEAT